MPALKQQQNNKKKVKGEEETIQAAQSLVPAFGVKAWPPGFGYFCMGIAVASESVSEALGRRSSRWKEILTLLALHLWTTWDATICTKPLSGVGFLCHASE